VSSLWFPFPAIPSLVPIKVKKKKKKSSLEKELERGFFICSSRKQIGSQARMTLR
jgi:hypothetical protein